MLGILGIINIIFACGSPTQINIINETKMHTHGHSHTYNKVIVELE